ncbi:hypothetical protein C4097_01155 [Clostridioides difficile]|nr:hypothetical protein QEW_4063 [Clostridioides difficile CD160]KPI46435.1 hypothetical protein KW95_18995 [Clostridioides difficile]KPI47208.1 hypothetical protein KW94_18500 [Clostridioides difficile]MDB3083169.1 hypothetical protein [Clostridioides difficile]CZR98865.1 hypothetical protein CDFC105_63662 [Clostridioides difficile]
MEKPNTKVVNFQEYKDRKNEREVNRDELLKLIKKIVTSK